MAWAYGDVCACPALMRVRIRTQVLMPTQQVLGSKEPSQLYKCLLFWIMFVCLCIFLLVGVCICWWKPEAFESSGAGVSGTCKPELKLLQEQEVLFCAFSAPGVWILW